MQETDFWSKQRGEYLFSEKKYTGAREESRENQRKGYTGEEGVGSSRHAWNSDDNDTFYLRGQTWK